MILVNDVWVAFVVPKDFEWFLRSWDLKLDVVFNTPRQNYVWILPML